MSCGEFPWDSQIFSQGVTRPVRITTISQWPHLRWLAGCDSHGPFKNSHTSHMSSQSVRFCGSFLARLLWYVCCLMYVFCEARFVKFLWDFHKSLFWFLWYLTYVFCETRSVKSLWDFSVSLLWWVWFLTGVFCETRSVNSLLDFFKCLTTMVMFSHGVLLWVSLGEIIVRFFKISHCDKHVFSWGSFVRLALWNNCEIFQNVSQWSLWFLMGDFCETRSVLSQRDFPVSLFGVLRFLTCVYWESHIGMSFWDFLYNSRVIHMFSHVRLSWDSLRYIVVRFSKYSFVILMLSHGCLWCDSSGETIMRFVKKSFAVYMNSQGIILWNFIFPFKLHWIHVSIICTTLVK